MMGYDRSGTVTAGVTAELSAGVRHLKGIARQVDLEQVALTSARRLRASSRRAMQLAALVLYDTVLLADGGRTLGTLLLGLRVVRMDRAPLTPRDALVRSAVVDGMGFVPLGWPIAAIVLEQHRLRQGPHDQAAGTLVVRTDEKNPCHPVDSSPSRSTHG
jgi:hypothetical protein